MKQFALLSLLIILYIIVYFTYYSIIEPLPTMGDGHDYHIPIAKSILDGSFLHLPQHLNPSVYYPGSSNAILSLFFLTHLPPYLFGLLGWVLLFILLTKLGKHFGLQAYVAVIFATAFCTTQSAMRLILSQSIDIWLMVFFVWGILLLENPKKTMSYFLRLGFALGMLVGSKTSGPLYIAVLGLIYWRVFLKNISIKNILAFIVPFSVFGLFWYVRNYIQFGSPIYPAPLFNMKGYPGFPLQDMMLYKTPFEKNGLFKFVEALFSEYLIWALSPLFVAIYVLKKLYSKKILVTGHEYTLIKLCVLTFVVSLLLPIPTINIISNMRYLFPLFIPSILFVFLIAQKYKQQEFIVLVALINIIPVMYYLHYHPKLTMLYFIPAIFIIHRREAVMRIFGKSS